MHPQKGLPTLLLVDKIIFYDDGRNLPLPKKIDKLLWQRVGPMRNDQDVLQEVRVQKLSHLGALGQK
jgi:hypothetical protein